MVIAPGQNGVTALVILADGEYLPANLNSERVVVMRCGNSTDRKPVVIKGYGELAEASILKTAEEPECTFPTGHSDPLHEHKDQTWWFYDVTWTFEQGPFPTKEAGYTALVAYCEELQKAQAPEAPAAEGATPNDSI
jgi:hypothetical protein